MNYPNVSYPHISFYKNDVLNMLKDYIKNGLSDELLDWFCDFCGWEIDSFLQNKISNEEIWNDMSLDKTKNEVSTRFMFDFYYTGQENDETIKIYSNIINMTYICYFHYLNENMIYSTNFLKMLNKKFIV
jgi:hypothetical protein